MITHRVNRNEHGDPVLTIKVTGVTDIARLAWHLERGQCEFADVGMRVHASLKRRMGRDRWKALEAHLWGPRGANADLRVKP